MESWIWIRWRFDSTAREWDNHAMRPCRLTVLPVGLASILALSFWQGCAVFLSLDEFDESSDAGTQADAGQGTDGAKGGGACSLLIDPASYDFGSVVEGESSPPLEFIVVSSHEGPIGPLALFGGQPPNPNFKLITQNCVGRTLDKGESCTIDMVFAPLEIGPQTAPLFIRDGTTDCATAFMRGEGTGDAPDAAPPPADAAPPPVDSAPPPKPPTAAPLVNPPLVSDTEIGLSWAAVAGATEYAVLWSTLNDGAAMSVDTTWVILVTDTSVDHWFSIFACNAGGCGPPTYVGPVKR